MAKRDTNEKPSGLGRQPQPKKLKREEEDELNESEEEPLQRKKASTKTKNEEMATEVDDPDVKCTVEGDKYINLGKNKRATVRNFKGKTLIDIREFYTVDGEEKPGKKGISLGVEQWENLINKSELLDKLVAEAATPK
ncbi:transcriptional Coactivator p15-domain-containing protein [Mycena rebaudengoi]|nr:transcriptional Coactivator p15-domain-containing protein [Mycena rebaudengoi]